MCRREEIRCTAASNIGKEAVDALTRGRSTDNTRDVRIGKIDKHAKPHMKRSHALPLLGLNGLAKPAMHEREAILPRHACSQRINDQIILKEMVARKGEEHAAKGTNEVREGVKIQDGADEAKTMAVEKIILDPLMPDAPNSENGEPRSGNGFRATISLTII